MAKRFITTTIFEDAWFMDLPNKYKLFWMFLITNCSHIGIWQVNYKLASFYVGDHLEPSECERMFKDRVIKIRDSKYWFIPKFIEFQYGNELSRKNRALTSVIENLEKYNLLRYLPEIEIKDGDNKGLGSSYKGVKDKDKEKDKDKVKDKEKNNSLLEDFNKARSIYPGTKKGNETEFDNFRKKHKDWKNVLPKLKPAIESQINSRKLKKQRNQFVPEWKHFQTWINQRAWEEEISVSDSSLARVYTYNELLDIRQHKDKDIFDKVIAVNTGKNNPEWVEKEFSNQYEQWES